MKTINITIKENTKEMVPMIYGHFVEFMRDCIDEGMWAQVLKNRGFDKKKDIPEGVVDGNPYVAEGWFRTGNKNSFEIALDAENTLARDGYAQKINCYNDYNGYVGIAQGNLCFDVAQYGGYIWIKADKEAIVSVHIKDDEHEFYKKEFHVSEGWNKYEFDFQSDAQTKNGILEIKLHGQAAIWLDGASIMPKDNIAGIWKDVFEHIKGINAPIIRYPGGCFADCYHFEDGIGAIDTRPYKMNRHWGGYVDNSFGTDEFIKFCRELGCEPMICINFGSASVQEAANWVEYCNGSIDTPYGKLRAENGNPEPYNIKYWDIGNEIFGEWEIGHSNAEDYAKKYLTFHKAMKEKDNSIVFMVCGGEGDDRSQEWNEKVAKIVKEDMDALCLHMYALKDMNGKTHDNKDVYYSTVGSVRKYEEILCDSYHTVNKDINKNILMAVTEYNLGSIIDSYREQTLEAAIFNAGMLNMFMRNCDKLLMCNYSDLVNGWPGGCIISKNGKAFGTGSYYTLQLYAKSNIKKVLEVDTDSPVYSTNEQIGNVEPLSAVPIIDVAAGLNESGRTVLFVINRSLEENAEINIGYTNKAVEITELYSENTSDMNSSGEMLILPVKKKINCESGQLTLKPHSINRFVIL